MLWNLSLLSPYAALAWALGLLVAIGIHEYGHARVAYALGDTTAQEAGRMTPNPFKHLSLMGTLFLVLFRFGWSEPVPVDPRNFRFPRRDTLLTAFAGPGANIVTAGLVGFVGHFLPAGTHLPILIDGVVLVNVFLALFNLLPIPPLDGASVLPYLFEQSPHVLFWIQQQGLFLLIGLFLFDAVAGGWIFGTLIGQPAQFLGQLFLGHVPLL